MENNHGERHVVLNAARLVRSHWTLFITDDCAPSAPACRGGRETEKLCSRQKKGAGVWERLNATRAPRSSQSQTAELPRRPGMGLRTHDRSVIRLKSRYM